MESSRTHLEVVGLGLDGQVLGLEAYKSSKMSCSRLDDSTVFDSLKMGHGHDLLFFTLEIGRNLAENLGRTFFFGGRLQNFLGPFCFCFFWRTLAPCVLGPLASSISGLGLERVCPREVDPWPWPQNFFEYLALKVVSSTPPLVTYFYWLTSFLSFCSLSRPFGRAETFSSLEWEIWGSNLGPVKSDTVLPTARHLP